MKTELTKASVLAAVVALMVLACSVNASAQSRPGLLRRAYGMQQSPTSQQPSGTQDVLPRPPKPFKGKIGRTAAESTPDFPKPVEAPKGAPNVLLIMTDDVGWGASSTFGGPIPTPTYDKLAKAGLRYNTFHTTALCSPTRAALITGRNHHTASTGVITEMATGYPGYNSLMSKGCGTIGEILKQNGYNTSWFGKNHNVPDWQSSQAGPFDLWPTSLGFEYFYGFIGGDTDQWHPAIFDGTHPIEAPNDPKYHLDADLADHAIAWIHQQHSLAPDKPFFAYYAPGLCHAPHHAPKEWIAKFKGQFDQGWDKLREETLARQIQQGVVPRRHQAHRPAQGNSGVGFLERRPEEALCPHDGGVCRLPGLLRFQHRAGHPGGGRHAANWTTRSSSTFRATTARAREGTMQGLANEVGVAANGVPESLDYLLSIMDGLGGPLYYNHYPVGWAHAMDTPFQWTKQVASHFGGTRNGLVISWPKHMKQTGEVRSQFCSVIDIAPTILEAAGVKQPTMINGVKQTPIEGTSLVYTFNDAKVPTRHKTQYFEMVGNRGVYDNGWVACTTPRRLPWQAAADSSPDDFKWELYHVAEDFSEANNLAADNPTKLKELQSIFDREAQEVSGFSTRCLLCRPRGRGHSPEPHSRAQHRSLTIRGRSVFPKVPRRT